MKLKLAIVSAAISSFNFAKTHLDKVQTDLKSQEGFLARLKSTDQCVFLGLKDNKLEVIPVKCDNAEAAKILALSYVTLIKDLDPEVRKNLAFNMQNQLTEYVHTEPELAEVGYPQQVTPNEGAV